MLVLHIVQIYVMYKLKTYNMYIYMMKNISKASKTFIISPMAYLVHLSTDQRVSSKRTSHQSGFIKEQRLCSVRCVRCVCGRESHMDMSFFDVF